MRNSVAIQRKARMPFSSLVKMGISKSYQGEHKVFENWLTHKRRVKNADSIRDYLLEQEKAGRQPATLQYKKSFLKAWVSIETLKSAPNEKKKVEDFFNAIKLPKPDKELNDEKFLKDDEIKTLISHAGTKVKLIIETLQQSGARVSELTSIRLSNCGKRGDVVQVRVVGKGGKTRNIYITRNLYAQINEVYQGKKYLFESESGNKLDRKNIYKEIKRIGLKAAKAEKNKYLASKFSVVTPHSLRHSAASNLLRSGIDIYSVKRILGHSYLQTTERYLHNNPVPEEVLGRFLKKYEQDGQN